MKKIVFSLMTVFALVLASCSGDDDNNNEDSATLEGAWKLTSWSTEGSIDLNNDGMASSNLLNEMNCYNNESLVFSSSNVVTYVGESYADITYEFVIGTTNEYTYNVDCIAEDEFDPATYTRNGNVLTITYDDSETGADTLIATISGNQISFTIEEGYYAEQESGGLEISQDLTYTFTKQ